jgi:hypothetical protein
MGISTSAKLIYGYRLRNENDGWLVKEVHDDDSPEYGLKLDWLGEDDDDFQDKAEDRLLAAAGFEDTGYEEDPDAWRARRKEARARVAVTFEIGGYEFSDLFLSVATYKAYLGELAQVTPGGLLVQSGAVADDRLASALATLGLTPLQEQPAWLLTACRG